MGINDIDVLNDQLPELFDPKPIPDVWTEDYYFERVENIEKPGRIDNALSEIISEDMATKAPTGNDTEYEGLAQARTDGILMDFDLGFFPGSSAQTVSGIYPPPDAWAFYLPIRYFYPDWWGIYLTIEGVNEFAQLLIKLSNHRIDENTAESAARLFLYYHEAFHHSVESFATRLEVTHRKPLYKVGFQKLFEKTYGTDECWEEALASAHAFRKLKLKKADFGNQWPWLEDALIEYIKGSGPGNRLAVEILDDESFRSKRASFAEDNHRESLPEAPVKSGELWHLFGHGFHGIANIKSRVNYMIHAESPLCDRLGLKSRLIKYNGFLKRLKKICPDLEKIRDGKGSHMIYYACGRQAAIPKHPGDLKKGTVKGILKELGNPMPLSKFMAL